LSQNKLINLRDAPRQPEMNRSLWLAFVPIYLILSLGIVLFEAHEFQHQHQNLLASARSDVDEYAGLVASRLQALFDELQFASLTFSPQEGTGLVTSDDKRLDAVRRYISMQPDIYAVDIVAADGRTPLWSSVGKDASPVAPTSEFIPVRGNPDFSIGRTHLVDQVGVRVLCLRLRVADSAGHTQFFIDASYRLRSLLSNGYGSRGAWHLQIVDQHDQGELGHGGVGAIHSESVTKPEPPSALISAEVPGYPFRVLASFPARSAWSVWFETGLVRWLLEATLLIVLLAIFMQYLRYQKQHTNERATYERALVEDVLTGLPNRPAFEAKLSALFADDFVQSGDSPWQLCVVALDIYQFTEFNDNWGHKAGDSVLLQMSERLKSLPNQLALARVGEDSFALAMRHIEAEQVNVLVERILSITDRSFVLDDGLELNLSISVGCVLYPADSSQIGNLLSQAEAALFTRAERMFSPEDREVEAYGASSAEMLTWAMKFIGARTEALAQTFYSHLSTEQQNHKIYSRLTTEQYTALQDHFADYLRQLLSPSLTATRHGQMAEHLGQVHALIGVSSKYLVDAFGWYQQAIFDLTRRIPGRLSQRLMIVQIIRKRLENDLSMQSMAGTAMREMFHRQINTVGEKIRSAERWVHIMDALTASIRHWPYVAFGAVYAQDVDGCFTLEAQTPGHGDLIESFNAMSFDISRAESQHPMSRAWMSGQLETVGNIHFDLSEDVSWLKAVKAHEVRSVVALPVLDDNQHILAVMVVYGKLPMQFETIWFQELLGHLRLLLSRGVQSLRTPTPAHISLSDRMSWRHQLFNNGLLMYVQPIMNLHTGQCTKVEALARLRLDDDRVLSPALFLPLLSDQELTRLFIEGLKLALSYLRDWQDAGLTLDLSFNLPPVTLRHPNCAHWIESELRHFNIDPDRLTFELLENEEISDPAGYNKAILSLHELGVHLAMDDLGSGYSSLLRLRTLPFDFVKIDQGMIRASEKTPYRSISMVGSLMRMAQGLELQVVVEGIETDDLLRATHAIGADFAQGYALAKPMPAEEIPAWVAAYAMPDMSAPLQDDSRMSVLATHWMWEQGIQDRQCDEPSEAHLHCDVGRYLSAKGLADTDMAYQHQQMHAFAQSDGVHSKNYLRARKAFYDQFSASQFGGA
jgi:diguanylate cyclase (GGDEF)-like protein